MTSINLISVVFLAMIDAGRNNVATLGGVFVYAYSSQTILKARKSPEDRILNISLWTPLPIQRVREGEHDAPHSIPHAMFYEILAFVFAFRCCVIFLINKLLFFELFRSVFGGVGYYTVLTKFFDQLLKISLEIWRPLSAQR